MEKIPLKCSKCNGDGLKLLPIKNIAQVNLSIREYDFETKSYHTKLIVPDFLTSIVSCDCVEKNLPIFTQN